jgi:hypothetical protein
MYKQIIIALLVTAATITGCKYEKIEPVTTCNIPETVSFATNVAPVIQSNCFSCHNNGFRLGNVSLEGFANVKAVAQSGKLLGVITHSAGFPAMPKGAAKLNACDIKTIEKWVQSGSQNN